MAKMINVRVTKNLYGNYRGFVTGLPSYEIGCNEWDACNWAMNALNEIPNSKLLDSSYITMKDIDKHSESLKK